MFKRLCEKLSRVTSGGSFIPEIDGLRFIAIFPVVLFHMFGTYIVVAKKTGVNWGLEAKQHWLVHLLSHGNYGVQIFFVISGFILALPFARTHFGLRAGPNLKSYFLRRVSRLEPTYIINLLIFYLVLTIFRKLSALEYLPNLLASMCYIHNQIFLEFSRISDVTWSLEIEIQFYILAPLLAQVFKISNKTFRRVLFVSIIFCAETATYSNIHLRLSLVNYIQYFMAGFLLADVYLLDWKENPEKNAMGDMVGLAGWMLFILILLEYVKIGSMLPFSILLFFYGVFRGRIHNYIFTLKGLVIIGGMCYSIYLYHNLIIGKALSMIVNQAPSIFSELGVLSGFGIVAMIILPIVLVISSILFALFERPFMNKEWYKFRRNKVATPLQGAEVEFNS